MPANVYECLFLLDSTKVAGDVPAADKQLRGLLEKNHAEVLISRPWDERRLLFPIKNQKKGLYYLVYFSSEGKNIVNIEHDCALNETILRMMILKIDPKLVEDMLSLARGDHAAVALHNYQEEASDGLSGIPEVGGDEGHRRRRPVEARE